MKKTIYIAVSIVMGALFLVVILILIGFMPGDTKTITSIADRFKPISTWRQDERIVRPPQMICLEANCNSLYYSWTTNEDVTREELRDVLERSHYSIEIKGDCKRELTAGGSGSTACSARGVVDDYNVEVDLTKSQDVANYTRIGLRVSKG